MKTVQQIKLLEHDRFLSTCQVDTPIDIVSNLWQFLNKKFGDFNNVLDLGAGDGRFATFGKYSSYHGYELDDRRNKSSILPNNAKLINKCAFSFKKTNYDLCIGNPPFAKQSKVEINWQNSIVNQLESTMKIKIYRNANVFLLFLCQALIKTNRDGAIALILPFEWVSRPSCKTVRDYIKQNQWKVSIYKFTENIFPGVSTTASITLIDKSQKCVDWEFFNINRKFEVTKIKWSTGTQYSLLKHMARTKTNYAQRGLSPGNQKVFCLTEQERKLNNLKINIDVIPCVTTLRLLPKSIKYLSKSVFNKHFVEDNQRCWLINTSQNNSFSLKKYLKSVPKSERSNATCLKQVTLVEL